MNGDAATQLDVIGNARALDAVRRSLASDAPPHAYLFTGPEAAGKRTLALYLAQALNCEQTATSVGARHASPLRPDKGQAPVEPCGNCSQCKRIARAIHPDVQTITVQPNADGEMRTGVAVEQVREAEMYASLNPYEGRTRVIIIDPADLMTNSAQNAFLKTLEEPPPNVVLVLIATNPDALLDTIRSRCARIGLRPVPAGDIEAGLLALPPELDEDGNVKRAPPTPDESRLLARLAGGRPGRAIALAREPALLEARREALEQARTLPRLSIGERMALSERLSGDFKADREAAYRLLSEWTAYWRDVLLVQSGAGEGVVNADMLEALRQDAARFDKAALTGFVEALLFAREALQRNAQSRITFDWLFLEAPVPITRNA